MLARRIPIIGVFAGIALLIVGFANDNTVLLIVGIVLIGLGIFRQFRNR